MEYSKRRKIQNGGEDSEKDPNWVPEEDETIQIQQTEGDNEGDDDSPLPDDIEFDSTEGFLLKPVKSSKQSNHMIWSLFGYLMKSGKNVKRVKDRIYCFKCFDKKQFKR